MKIIISVVSILSMFSLLQGCPKPRPEAKYYDQVASARPVSDIAKALAPITKEEERNFCNGIRENFGGITGPVASPLQARSNLFLRLSKHADPRVKEITVYNSNDWGVRGDRSLEGKDLLVVDVDKIWLPNIVGSRCDTATFYSVAEFKALSGDGYGIRLAGGNVYAIKGKNLDEFIGKPLVFAYRTHMSDREARSDLYTPAEIEAIKADPKTHFCEDMSKEFVELRGTEVKGVSPGGAELALGILQSAKVRAPKVPGLKSLLRCDSGGPKLWWIIEKIEKNGATYHLTMRNGNHFDIEPKVAGTDLSILVGLPQSTVLIAYPNRD